MAISTSRRSFMIDEFNLDSLAVCETEIGKLAPTEVLISVKAVSLNFRDLMVCSGIYNPRFKLPLVPLSDAAGQVVEVGSHCTRLSVGDRVSPIFMQDWHGGAIKSSYARSALGGERSGVFQSYLVLDENGLVKIPDYLSWHEAATLPCAAVTAWNSLFEATHLLPGETVLVLGTGGVSIFSLQLARAAGAKVIATSSSSNKCQRLLDMGADFVVNYKEHPKWSDKVLELTGGQGVDHVIEVGGTGTLSQSIKAVKAGGHIALIGVLAEQGDGKPDLLKAIMKAVRISGVFVGSRDMFESLNRCLSNNRIHPVIDKVFPADEIIDAMKHMQAGKHFGKIVLEF